MSHEHALLAAEDELLAAYPSEFAIEGLGERERGPEFILDCILRFQRVL